MLEKTLLTITVEECLVLMIAWQLAGIFSALIIRRVKQYGQKTNRS